MTAEQTDEPQSSRDDRAVAPCCCAGAGKAAGIVHRYPDDRRCRLEFVGWAALATS